MRRSRLFCGSPVRELPRPAAGAVVAPRAGFSRCRPSPMYRLAIAWPNTGYSQPSHLSYALGH